MRSRPLTRLLTAVLCAVGMLGVAGLSGCTGSTASPASGKITLGFSAWPGWNVWQVAQEQGLFAQNGVEVELKWFDSYTDSLNALATGAIDANSQTLNDTLMSVSGGARQTVVLVNDNSTGNDKIISRDGIAGVADLKGKKVAVEQGTVDHYLLLLALAEAKLSEKDIELVPLVTDAAAAAFVAGRVDAVGAFAPFTTKALERPGSRAIATSAEFPGAIPDHLVVKSDLVKDNPQVVQGVVNTWFATLAWIKDNRDAAVGIMAKRNGVSVEDYKSYDSGTTIFTRQQNIDAFTPGTTPQHLNHQARLASDFLMSTGLAKNTPNLDGLFNDAFVKAVPE
ncbi:ABC transporter substrate-binding protein [Kibdelosporangium persicum]|uniref:Periplasmic substrate-binding component of ABC-type sulfonate/nitrate/taurine transport system n=1 Tax=Kibdelosporangium persicum TaxID=2698649 RepID=A0ABX2F412_9PSEU|nr:ABC transporter substrate-binding protein [Kibdelosporangium persicum]NRN65928.1 Periplasmic substrate-binding component of ABC-type sulfonate/nitrate/taurine transport system [Kibdelosporangium persicum]